MYERVRAFGVPLLVLLPLALVSTAGPSRAAELREFAESFRYNRQQLRNYSWKSRIEVTLAGQTQAIQTFEVRYDAEGNREKTLIASEVDPTAVRGPVRKRKASKKQKQQQERQAELKRLIKAYVEPDPKTSRQLFESATVWEGQGRTEGVTRVLARNVIRQGDLISLWLDSLTRNPRKLEIVTSSGGEPVKVTTEFRTLDDGAFYPAVTIIETEIKEKKLVMKTENFDYLPRGG